MLHSEEFNHESSELCIAEKEEEEEKKTHPDFWQFSDDLGLHGYLQVGHERGVRRILWGILFAASIAISVYMVKGAIHAYLEHQTYLEVKQFKFPRDDLIFPTITVCTKIPLVKYGYDRVRKLVNITEKEFEDFHYRYLSRYRAKVPANPKAEAKILKALYDNNITSTEEVISLFELNEDDMFGNPLAKKFLITLKGNPDYPTCRYNYKRDCKTRRIYSVKESLCQQMNFFEAGNEKGESEGWKGWVARSKSFGNLIAVLNIGSRDTLPRTNKVRKTAPYMDMIDGAVVYINSFGNTFERSRIAERIFLAPGYWHFLKLDYTEVYHLPEPYPFGCGTKPFKRIKPEYNYTRDLCINDCILDNVFKECGCVGWEWKNFVDLPICDISNAHCYLNGNGQFVNDCKTKYGCQRDCVHYKYNVNVETLDLRDDRIIEQAVTIPGWNLTRTQTEDFVKQNLLGLQLVYTPAAKLEFHRAIISFGDLLATIGGTLGLGIGFNIIIVFKFIQFSYDYIKLLMQKKSK